MPQWDGNGNPVQSWGEWLNNLPDQLLKLGVKGGIAVQQMSPILPDDADATGFPRPAQPDRDVTPPHNPAYDEMTAYPPARDTPARPWEDQIGDPLPDTDIGHIPWFNPDEPATEKGRLLETDPSFGWVPDELKRSKPTAPMRPELLHKAAADAAADVTPAASPFDSINSVTKSAAPFAIQQQPDGSYKVVKQTQQIDQMRPKLTWIDRDANPVQPATSILAPWWPQASNISDWLSGPPGRPQATDDPAYVRRFEGTLPLQGVRYATPQESRQQLLNNAPWLARLLGN